MTKTAKVCLLAMSLSAVLQEEAMLPRMNMNLIEEIAGRAEIGWLVGRSSV